MYSFELVLIISIFLICLLNLNKNYNLGLIIIYSFLIRIIFIIVDIYLFKIPFSILDSNTFELKAAQWGREGFLYALSNFFREGNSFIYSNFLSVFYSILGRSILFSKLLSALFSLFCLYLIHKIIEIIWKKKKYSEVSLILLSFSPMFIIISIITLREIYTIFVLLSSVYLYLMYEEKNDILLFYAAILISLFHIYLHGPMVLVIINFLIIYYISNLIKIFNKDYKFYSTFLITNFIFILIFLISFTTQYKIIIPYVGDISNYYNFLEILQKRFIDTAYGRTAYPDLFYPKDLLNLIILIPVRFIYFICGPFYAVKIFDFVVIFESIVYFYLLTLIIINIKIIFRNNYSLYLIILCIPLIIFYSWGVNNYGTAIRHKIKFLPFILILVSPFIYSNFKYVQNKILILSKK